MTCNNLNGKDKTRLEDECICRNEYARQIVCKNQLDTAKINEN